MKVKKSRAATPPAAPTKPAAIVERSRAWCPFMFLLPSPDGGSDWTSGVLRRQYNRRRNDVVEYVKSKLHPVDAPPPGAPWKPTAVRWEVVLPPGGIADHLLDPKCLAERFAEQLLPWQTSLLMVIKIVPDAPLAGTLNEPWQLVHSWLVARVCRARGLPSILVQHEPSRAGIETVSSHLHVLIFSRRMAGNSSFAGVDFELTCDEGHGPLYRDFKAHAALFGR